MVVDETKLQDGLQPAFFYVTPDRLLTRKELGKK